MADLYLIRHGQTALNKEGRLRSHKDVPLDADGMREAHEIGQKLRQIDPSISTLHASDLQRSRQTAHAISASTGSGVVINHELRPWDLGSLAGQKIRDIIPDLDRLQAHPDEKAPNGESFNEFFARWHKFLSDKVSESRKAPEPSAMVVHSRHLLSLDHAISAIHGEKVDTSKVPSTGGPGPGGIVVLRLGKSIKPEVIDNGDDTGDKASG